MTEHYCPHCQKPFKSIRSYNNHLLFEHDAFSNAEFVEEVALKQLKTMKEQVYHKYFARE